MTQPSILQPSSNPGRISSWARRFLWSGIGGAVLMIAVLVAVGLAGGASTASAQTVTPSKPQTQPGATQRTSATSGSVVWPLSPALQSAASLGVCSKFKSHAACLLGSDSTQSYCQWTGNRCVLHNEFQCGAGAANFEHGGQCYAPPGVPQPSNNAMYANVWQQRACAMDKRLQWHSATNSCKHKGEITCMGNSSRQWYGEAEGCLPKTCVVNGVTHRRNARGICLGANPAQTRRLRAKELKAYFVASGLAEPSNVYRLRNPSADSVCGLHVVYPNKMRAATRYFFSWVLPRQHQLVIKTGSDPLADGRDFGHHVTWNPSGSKTQGGSMQSWPAVQNLPWNHSSWTTVQSLGTLPSGYVNTVYGKKIGDVTSRQAGAFLVDRLPGRWTEWGQLLRYLPECNP